jgi:hypothetical protein
LGLQLKYFLNLRADVITSCCGSLFSEDTKGLTGDMAGLPPLAAMIGFYGLLALAFATASFHVQTGRGGIWVGVTGIAAFAAALTGIISFVSLYIYEHPHHHCPFCILKPEYDWQGYWLYVPLFLAAAAATGVGAVQPFRHRPSLRAVIPAASRRLAAVAAAGFLTFALVATAMVARSNLILLES